MRRTTLAALALASGALLAGCSTTVSAADVEEQISNQLEAQVGQAPDKVDCPGDLEGTVDATMTCVLTAGPDTLDVTVTVTEVDGNDVKFDIQVADQVN
jgi:outer membrane murein-binding lipoprotein Lpp